MEILNELKENLENEGCILYFKKGVIDKLFEDAEQKMKHEILKAAFWQPITKEQAQRSFCEDHQMLDCHCLITTPEQYYKQLFENE